ncbi:PREDICTED: formin-like protein 14-like [Chrysochloris asiatica]|uniref:Formin-like protein 14-like n=1 Tax=Chrysochloris asiatica TaxID=185453 RepID=A0A9B0TBM7_CHRAS|nr:PREDICTED: formin-like protein 14-like [Chrysochloris asiatica]
MAPDLASGPRRLPELPPSPPPPPPPQRTSAAALSPQRRGLPGRPGAGGRALAGPGTRAGSRLRPPGVWRQLRWRRGGGGGSPSDFKFPSSPPPLPPRRRPSAEWLRRGRPRAGAGRGPGRGYKGNQYRPLHTHSLCPVLRGGFLAAAVLLARPPQPAWTPGAPPDGRHQPTDARASGQARPAGSARVKRPK